MKKGMISVGVAIVMMILLTLASATLISSGDLLRAQGYKKEHQGRFHTVRSASCVLQMKLDQYTEQGVEMVALRTKKEFTHAWKDLSEEEKVQATESFHKRMYDYYGNGHELPLKEEIGQENLGNLRYKIIEFRYPKEKQQVEIVADILDDNYNVGRNLRLRYIIPIDPPTAEEMADIWKGEFNALKKKYRSRTHKDMAEATGQE